MLLGHDSNAVLVESDVGICVYCADELRDDDDDDFVGDTTRRSRGDGSRSSVEASR
jgi:hypothetical protein